MAKWRVTIRCREDTEEEISPEAMAKALGALQAYEAVGETNPGFYQVTMTVEAPSGAKARRLAVTKAVGSEAGLPNWPVTHTEVVARDDIPSLVGVPEIAEMLGVHVERARAIIRSYDSFPAPLGQLGRTKIWTEEAVRAWAQTWERKPGRPRKDRAGAPQPTDYVGSDVIKRGA